jgi:transposase
LARAHAWFADRGVVIQRVLTDNGGCYRSHLWHQTCQQLAVTPRRTRPYRPQTNGKVERFNRTLVEGWAYRRLYASEAARRAAFGPWLHWYNHHRPTPHSAVAHRSPAAPTSPSPTFSQALRVLEQRHRGRYQELYQQELDTARSEPLPLRRGRPPGAPDRLSVAPESLEWTWRPDGSRRRRRRPQVTKGARQRAQRQAVRARAVELFREGRSAATVAEEVGVARQTVTVWRARWQPGGSAALLSGGAGRRPAIPDSQLPAIEEALLKGAGAHGFDGEVWTSTRVAIVVQRVTGVKLGSTGVQRLLRDRLGWRFQPAASDATVATALQPLPVEAAATESLAAVAEAAVADLEDRPPVLSHGARSGRPASPAERRDAIAQAWRTEPGITDAALAERFGVSSRAIQRDIRALQERGVRRGEPSAPKPPAPGALCRHLPAVPHLVGR